jgi:hypothetical protein
MNLDEYRALMAQQEVEQEQPQGDVADVQVKQSTATPPVQTQEETTQTGDGNQEPPTQSAPQVIEIDGAEVPVDELKNGYLRQSDYTRKTQELAQQKAQLEIAQKYYEALQSNPAEAKLFAEKNNLPYLSPQEMELTQIKQQYEDMLVQQEVALMKTKYPDFNEADVVKFTVENKMNSLEDAYLLLKAKSGSAQSQPADIEAIKQQIRQEVLQELQSNQSTGSIIGTQGVQRPVVDDTPTLSEAERKVARGLRMSDKEYVKWRDAK